MIRKTVDDNSFIWLRTTGARPNTAAQHPANHAVRNAKMSGTVIPPMWSKSARGSCANHAERNAKMSGTSRTPFWSKSAAHGGAPVGVIQ